ncbi:MAG: alpha/beta fold hydrolase [Dehalococcoidia bacterium]
MPEIHANGLRFNTHQIGSGDPVVVLIHGLVVDNLSSWYFSIAPALAARCTVLLYDLRGHGASEQPPSGYTIEDMALDLRAIVDASGLAGRPLVLAGNSTGGLVGLRFALRYPEAVASLVLIDAHLAQSDFGRQMATTLELEGDAREEKIHELFGNWVDGHTVDGEPDADVQATMRMFRRIGKRRRNPLATRAQELTSNTSLVVDLRDTPQTEDAELRSLTMPVLALYGEHSDLRSEGERVAALIPRCTLELVPGATHGLIWQATTMLRQRLVDWVDELDLTARP